MGETRSVETDAPDIEEAIEEGLQILDVARENVIVEILDEPSRGLLGIGARMARVRLTTALPPRREREEFAASSGNAAGTAVQPAVEDEIPSGKVDSATERREALSEEDAAEISEDVQQGAAILRELLRYMQIEASVSIERILADPGQPDEQNPWVLHVQGDDLGVLIGHRGRTLSALQYMARLIASRDIQHRADFIVDVENYKARRQVLLTRLAQRMAKDAVRRQRTMELEPMPPHERRVIHMALRDHDEVVTRSVGEGDHRRVTIVPN